MKVRHAPTRLAVGSLLALMLGTIVAAPAAAAQSTAVPATKKPCPDDIAAGWKCVTLTVPVDWFHNTGKTTKVTFALKRHTGSGPAKGTWVTITGGPGSAGIYSAIDYSDTFAASVRRNYDMVFMDQRGSGMSGGFTCPYAALAYYTDESPADAGAKQAAKTFVNDCIDESNVDVSMLPYFATKQAVEDLEAFRKWLGVSKMSLYGESYGTQYVQQYAAAHPNNVKALFLDGPVDLLTKGPAYYVEGAEAFDQTLRATLLDCTTEPVCSRDVKGGNAMTAWSRLAARLEDGPISYTYTRPNGTKVQRQFSSTDLENAAAGSMYNRTGRRLLQRAMGPASHGNLWWLARLSYAQVVQNPDTLEPILDPSWSDALYYAVECMDYPYFPNAGTPNQRADAFLAYGRKRGTNQMLLPAAYNTDLPCVYWPTQPGPDPRPAPTPNAPYPLIVMGSTTDPATPFGNAQRIVERRGNNPYGTWLIYQPGGPHVIYGRYESCPDKYVTDILVNNKYPKKHILTCPGGIAADYVRNPDAAQVVDNGRRDLLAAYENELNYGVDYWFWDYSAPLKLGCAFGGMLRYTATDVGSRLVMDGCSFVRGARATGEGRINDYTGRFRLDVTFSGQWQGHAAYTRSPNGDVTLTGNLSYVGSD